MTGDTAIPNHLIDVSEVNVDEFKQLCSRTSAKAEYPLASSIEKNIPIYDLAKFDPDSSNDRIGLQREWNKALLTGPGVIVLKQMFTPDQYQNVLAAVNGAFHRIHEKESRELSHVGDHFDTAGKNKRIWNSLQKHAMEDPDSFIEYYANPWLGVVSESWLGPGYRITAQVNSVTPGGQAQRCHADYHLGMQEVEDCKKFPRSLQNASKHLTLQGAVAHSDMPIESGPTRFLPFSQQYEPGFLAWRHKDFISFFDNNYVSLPLQLGDGVFFNPGIFHAAGANETDPAKGFQRTANLLQIHCSFSKAMESIDTIPIVSSCWDTLSTKFKGLSDSEISAVIHAAVDAYPYPTNLDKQPPRADSMMPENEQQLLFRALKLGWAKEQVVQVLEKIQKDSLP
uniref:ARAD1C00286p n=1 Tax=Blastobotrys adeninivorans TaxID=409370 RepID=A0A060T3Z3_BLAAD